MFFINKTQLYQLPGRCDPNVIKLRIIVIYPIENAQLIRYNYYY